MLRLVLLAFVVSLAFGAALVLLPVLGQDTPLSVLFLLWVPVGILYRLWAIGVALVVVGWALWRRDRSWARWVAAAGASWTGVVVGFLAVAIGGCLNCPP